MQLAHTTGMMFYFNVPRNEILMGYWDTVADRLYSFQTSLIKDVIIHINDTARIGRGGNK